MRARCTSIAGCTALLLPALAAASSPASRAASGAIVTGKGFGLEVSTGLIGVFTPLNASWTRFFLQEDQ